MTDRKRNRFEGFDPALVALFQQNKRRKLSERKKSLAADLKRTNMFFISECEASLTSADLTKLEQDADHIREVCTPRGATATPTSADSNTPHTLFPPSDHSSPFTPHSINNSEATDAAFAHQPDMPSAYYPSTPHSYDLFNVPTNVCIDSLIGVYDAFFPPYDHSSPFTPHSINNSEATDAAFAMHFDRPITRTRTFNGIQFNMPPPYHATKDFQARSPPPPPPPLRTTNTNPFNRYQQHQRKQQASAATPMESLTTSTQHSHASTQASSFKPVQVQNPTGERPQPSTVSTLYTPKTVDRIPGFNLHTVSTFTTNVDKQKEDASLLSHIAVCSLGAFRANLYNFHKETVFLSLQLLMHMIFEQGQTVQFGIGKLNAFNRTHPLAQRPDESLLTHALSTCAVCGYGLKADKLSNKEKGCVSLTFVTRRCGHLLRYHRKCARKYYVNDTDCNRLVICPLCTDNAPKGFDEHLITVPQARNKSYQGEHLTCFFDPCAACKMNTRMVTEDYQENVVKRITFFQENIFARTQDPTQPGMIDNVSDNTLTRKCFHCSTNLSAKNFWVQVCCARAPTHPSVNTTMLQPPLRCATCGPHCLKPTVLPRRHKRCTGECAWVTECTDIVCGCPHTFTIRMERNPHGVENNAAAAD
jgi:hypothetical protein